MGSCGPNEPVRIYATGACNVDKKILELKDSNPSEAIDTANILIEFESGSTATIQVSPYIYTAVCRRAPISGISGIDLTPNTTPRSAARPHVSVGLKTEGDLQERNVDFPSGGGGYNRTFTSPLLFLSLCRLYILLFASPLPSFTIKNSVLAS